ncbi:hypothetical protein ACW7G2_13800 [Luteimonas sp. A277]
MRAIRLRVVLSSALVVLPPVAAAAVLAWRFGGAGAAVATAVAGLAVATAFTAWRARRINAHWLARALDARRRDMEDSAALLFSARAQLAPLQLLQRERLRQRIATTPMPDLRPPWPRRPASVAAGGAALVIAAALMWPTQVDRDGMRAAPSQAVVPGAPRLEAWRLRIEPPAYTGLGAWDAETLDVEAPQGSQLRWTLRFVPEPDGAALAFHDGDETAMELAEGGWSAAHVLVRSVLYRILPAGAAPQPAPPLHRLDAVADQAPSVRVLAPERSLSLMEPGQRQWQLAFEATDDYGVAANATLRLTLAQGTGENITFTESARTVRGSGPPTRRRFETALDPIVLGLQPGEDLVVRLEVRDNRAPGPQAGRSPSLILRWPPAPPPDVDGLDAFAREVLPAYFRSQRQIIIDAEALLEQRPALAPEQFAGRSDALGVDQRILRLRYGQFMGEEAEDGPGLPVDHAPPVPVPAPTLLPIDDFGQEPEPLSAPAGGDGDHARVGMADLHDHDHGGGQPREAAAFGSMEGVLEEYAHLHDLPEAATLLDPRTRETLRLALGEMWQSELALRQGDPERALPYAYRALAHIQQVREADRIYLARVGTQLPPIDESRRLGGERDGIARRALAPTLRDAGGDELEFLWQSMAEAPGIEGADLELLDAWAAANGNRLDDPLALAAALDALRSEPACISCRGDLRALLWTLIERPAAQVPRRAEADAAGGRYLDALQMEDAL